MIPIQGPKVNALSLSWGITAQAYQNGATQWAVCVANIIGGANAQRERGRCSRLARGFRYHCFLGDSGEQSSGLASRTENAKG